MSCAKIRLEVCKDTRSFKVAHRDQALPDVAEGAFDQPAVVPELGVATVVHLGEVVVDAIAHQQLGGQLGARESAVEQKPVDDLDNGFRHVGRIVAVHDGLRHRHTCRVERLLRNRARGAFAPAE